MSLELVKIEIFSQIVPNYLKALTETSSVDSASEVTNDLIVKLTTQLQLLNKGDSKKVEV